MQKWLRVKVNSERMQNRVNEVEHDGRRCETGSESE